MKKIIKNKTIYLTMLLSIIIDQIIKYIVESNMNLYQSIPIIKNFFYISFVKNIGAAFSILSNKTILLSLTAVVISLIIYIFFIKDKELNNLNKITYGLLLGGIIGNLIDRVFRGYVVDYLDFVILKYDCPVFNLADALIVCSVFLIIIWILRGEKDANKNR